MPTQTGELGVTFPDNTLQTTAAIAGTSGFGGIQYTQVFTASAVWLCPTGVTRVRATVVGGGGGSAGDGGDTNWGGMAGYSIGVYTVVPGTSYSVTVGLGGRGGANPYPTPIPSDGAGGTSSFSSFCSATGGSYSTSAIPPVAGIGSGGTIRNNSINRFNGYTECVGLSPYLAGIGYENHSPSPVAGQPFLISGPYAAGAGGYSGPGIGGAVVLEY